MTLKLITAPTEHPISLAEARKHLMDPPTARDAQILALIYAAVEHAEDYLGRGLCTQTWELVLPSFPLCEVKLPKPPLQQVVSIKYRDANNVEQTLSASDYQVVFDEYRGQVKPVSTASWPSTYERLDAVTVRFKCGYGVAAQVPYSMQAALLLHVEAHFNRDERQMEKLLEARDALLYPRRVF